MEHRLSVDSVLSSADCVEARRYGSASVIGEIDKRGREIFAPFGVPHPDEVFTDRQVCDPAELMGMKD